MKIKQLVVTTKKAKHKLDELLRKGVVVRRYVRRKEIVFGGNLISLEYLPIKLNWSRVRVVYVMFNKSDDITIIVYQPKKDLNHD